MTSFIRTPRTSQFKVGDVLIGLKSSGLHSNGFTKVRSLFGQGEWREDFVRPTEIYLDVVHAILKKYEVHGMMHITGGAFTKLRDLLKGADAVIKQPVKLAPQPIFHELYKRGVSDRDMYRTFNCGIGFVLAVPGKSVKKIIAMTPGSAVIGRVVKGKGMVHIQSAFSGKTIVL